METLSQVNQIGQIGCLQLNIVTFIVTSIIFILLITLAFHNGLISFKLIFFTSSSLPIIDSFMLSW